MANQVKINFNKKHEGLLLSQSSETNISFKGEGFEPYELFLGGYASCLHATFLGIARKKRIEFTDVNYDVYATKREEVPTTLNYIKTTCTFTGVKEEKQKAIIKSMDLAEKYCSISALINMVATMEFEYIFK
jgi:putative redox protein